MTYEPAAYWLDRGRTYRARFRAGRYSEQEAELRRVLAGMDFESVLEVGCGFGRIARLIRSVRPDAEYTGIDISPTMIASADVPGVIVSSLADYRPRRKYDLVIAVEVLMHVPPRDVQAAVRKLDRLASRYIVTCDWTVPVANVADHNFLHDYSGIGGRAIPVGMQSIRVIEK